jgi:tetratricopeptide (TPR) repeat protein
MGALASQFAEEDDTYRSALVLAEVASTAHRFAEARVHLDRAALMGGPSQDIEQQTLAIDQACGVELERVLAARRRMAAMSGNPQDLVPLGAVLADLERFAEAEGVYQQAFDTYDTTSPFPPAWACFQLGMLWGELVPVPDPNVAALWYRRALGYLPGYRTARVHLAEIYTSQDETDEAENLLRPALVSGDPEVCWRLADVLMARERVEEAEIQIEAARSGFEEVLARHLLAFADHAAEFYAGCGRDHRRALELARVNVANRPTRRALRQAQAIAVKMSIAGGGSHDQG